MPIYLDIGLKPYREALEFQLRLREMRLKSEIPDALVFCEHPSIFTLGKRDCSSDFVSDASEISADGIDVVQTDRGGKITYHGPGQLIGYFIFNVTGLGLGVKDFVRVVEEMCLLTLSEFGLEASRDNEHPGLWIKGKKIVALGFHFFRGVSCHGFALNISPDLGHYRHIIPCGITGRGVTSMKAEGAVARRTDVVCSLVKSAGKVFDQTFTYSTEEKVRGFSSAKTFSTSAFFDSSGRDLTKSA